MLFKRQTNNVRVFVFLISDQTLNILLFLLQDPLPLGIEHFEGVEDGFFWIGSCNQSNLHQTLGVTIKGLNKTSPSPV